MQKLESKCTRTKLHLRNNGQYPEKNRHRNTRSPDFIKKQIDNVQKLFEVLFKEPTCH
jgi:hypothetical protein